jgi:pilus assembly protein CpaE
MNAATRRELDYPDAAPAAPERRRDFRPIPRITIQAFCESHEVASAMEGAREDRRMGRAHLKIQTGGLSAAADFYHDSATPNVLILETTDKRDRILHDLGRLSDVCDPATKVVIVGHVNDILLYRELMRLGISEYVVTPVTPLDVVEIVSNLFGDPKAKPVGRAISFVGAKGGVGASTIAHNVGWTLAGEFALDTTIADLDLPFGTANLDFNQDPTQGVADAVFSPERLDATFLDRLLVNCGPHLNLLAAPSTLDRTYDFGEGSFEAMVDLVRNQSPFVVFDMPHMWCGWVKKTLIASDEIVIVASPDLANLRNTKNLVDLLKQNRPHDPPPKLILNQVGVPKRSEIKVADFTRSIDAPLIATLPFDAALFGTAANNGQMLAEVQKQSKVAEEIRRIAETVSDRVPARKAKGLSAQLPLLSRIQSLVPGRKAS